MNTGHFRRNLVSSGDLNRPRESRGSQTSISLKHGRLAHVRSQFSLFRRSPTHKNLPPATFCTSERVLAVLFARRKKYQSVSLSGSSRFCKPRSSTHKQQLPTNKIKSFCRFAAFASPSAALSVAAATTFVASRLFLRLRRFFRRHSRLCNFPMESSSLPGRHAPRAFSAACGGTSRRHSRQKGHQTEPV